MSLVLTLYVNDAKRLATIEIKRRMGELPESREMGIPSRYAEVVHYESEGPLVLAAKALKKVENFWKETPE